jgi:phage tail-like protein
LNEEHQPLVYWKIIHAYPVKWSAEDFSALESKVVVESFELAYNYFNRTKKKIIMLIEIKELMYQNK